MLIQYLYGAYQQIPAQTKATLDVAAVSGTLAALLDVVPAATAIVTFVWTLIRLYETKTVQKIIRKVKERFGDHPSQT